MIAPRSLPIAALALAGLVLTAVVFLGAMRPAAAQERIEHRSIIDLLFGRRQDAYPAAPPPPGQGPRTKAPKRTRVPARQQQPPAAATDTPPAVEKNPDARTVLVVGDFMASGLADGLSEAFAASPGVIIDDETNGSSGLVRTDYYDWPAEVGTILDKARPAAVVVLLGANDRQQMMVNGSREPVRSDAWTAEYTRRAAALAARIVARKVPLLWVGEPAFQSPSMSADILALDGIFRSVATAAGGEFVDAWDGFVDENGQFVFSGSDINGQPVRLRGPDGINLTAAGKRKLAFYVEKPLRRILGDAAGGMAGLTADPPATGEPVRKPPSEVLRTPPIALDDPALDGDTALLGGGGDTAAPVDPRSPRTLLVNEGRIRKPPAGRADAASWDADPHDAEPTAEVPVDPAARFGPPPPPRSPAGGNRQADAGDPHPPAP